MQNNLYFRIVHQGSLIPVSASSKYYRYHIRGRNLCCISLVKNSLPYTHPCQNKILNHHTKSVNLDLSANCNCFKKKKLGHFSTFFYFWEFEFVLLLYVILTFYTCNVFKKNSWKDQLKIIWFLINRIRSKKCSGF